MTGRICGTGSCVPSFVMDNNDIAKLVDTSDEWTIYVSKEKTMVNTDQYIQDRKIAKKIEEMIKNVCEIS